MIYEMVVATIHDPATAADLLFVPCAATPGLGLLADRLKFTPATWDVEARTEANRAIEEGVWRDVCECAAWALYRLGPDERASRVASVLAHVSSLARPGMYGQPAAVLMHRARRAISSNSGFCTGRARVPRMVGTRWTRFPCLACRFSRQAPRSVPMRGNACAGGLWPNNTPEYVYWFAAIKGAHHAIG